MPRFNYIVTIHNKEDLIEKVVAGILYAAGRDSHVYLVLDGCTDGTERMIDLMMDETTGLPVTKLKAPNVHEILSLNIALRKVPQEGDGYNILVQDDILLSDWNFEEKVLAVYEHFGHRIGVLSFRHGINLAIDEQKHSIEECDVIESSYGHGACEVPLLPGFAVKRMVCLRSPQCISFETVRRVGYLDEKYAPYCYDDHDYGLRCLQAGMINAVYAVNVRSRVEWGGMRRKPQPGAAAIMRRNKGYVYDDYAEYIRSVRREAFLEAPVRIPCDAPVDSAAEARRRYDENRTLLRKYYRKQSFNLVRHIRQKFGL